jgi:ABC-2 type transport system ATP-binding protein
LEAQVRAEHLSKTFHVGFFARKVRAVEDLSFEVLRGEIFGLLGPNGAGKTTTIKMLLGFVRPTAGAAFVGEARAGTLQARRDLGYLPENPALYEFLRGDEYLVFAGRLLGLSRSDARAQAKVLLERVGLAGRADRPVRRFSKGMVQRLGLAQALIGDPHTVVLDEPMSGLDPIGRKDVRDLILGLRAEGRTVLFSTHILSDVESICDRVGIVVDGRLTDCGALTDLVAPGARAVELVVENLPQALEDAFRANGAQALKRDRGTVLTFRDEAAAREALRAAVAASAVVVSLTPHRRSLEELFVARARGTATTS